MVATGAWLEAVGSGDLSAPPSSEAVGVGAHGGGPGCGLLDYVVRVSPEFDRPSHLGEVARVFERALAGEPVRVGCSVAVRHFKTETFLHGVLWLLEHIPSLRIVLMTYSNERALHVGKRLRELAKRTKVGPVRGQDVITNWQNEHGGGVVVMSADQSKEGHDCHVLLCDDPIDEHGAKSPEKREEVDRAINYYTARCMRKGKPGPVILVMSRQHPDDPIGRRIARKAVKWDIIHRPAIIDLGLPTERAFAPAVWGLDALKAMRAELAEDDPYETIFWSRLQGEPRVEGASFYREPARYADLPMWPGFRDAIGIDMSFSEKRKSDWFAVILVRFFGRQAFVRNVVRFKPDPRELPGVLHGMLADAAGGTCPMFSYVSGPEVGTLSRLAVDHRLNIQGMPAQVNKLWRTQRTVKRWNAGEILVPADAPWATAFIKRVKGFTGVDGDEDDESDALVSVCDAMLGLVGQAGPGTVGPRRI